jgi:uncharacterized protein
MITRKEALEILKKHVPNENLQKHCFACEVVMQFLAKELGENEQIWGLAGLLHDIDYTETMDDPQMHSLVAVKILQNLDLSEEIIYAVKVHNEIHGLPRRNLLDKALYAVDPMTGLIVAAALIKSEKKLNAIDVSFVMKRFAEKSFAKGANREQIETCSELGLSLEEFLSLGLKAMQSIDKKLGL